LTTADQIKYVFAPCPTAASGWVGAPWWIVVLSAVLALFFYGAAPARAWVNTIRHARRSRSRR
jgi:hypothetical protein